MKTSYIISLLVIVIAGVAWFSTQTKNTAPVQEVQVVPKTETTNTPVTKTQTTPAVEQPVIAASSTGNDVGMEMPESDMGMMKDAKVFTVSGKNFAFDVKEINVKKGDTVTINFTSADGFHDFVIDQFNAKTTRVKTGETTKVTFVADKAGAFEYYCSVGQHRMNGMVGKLIVE